MKKIILILITALAIYSAFFWLVLKDKIKFPENIQEENTEIAEEEVVKEEVQSKVCFSRNQEATEEAPYSVSEYIELNIDKNIVSGIKTGNQSGPDMTNGYQGTLAGEIKDQKIEVIFDYTIEGSDQKEREEYLLKDAGLVKNRYQLIEENGFLVPDKNTPPTEIIYTKTDCL
ncbi:MAG: hypothetical protein R3B55_03685 [Candidatus Paceibacterota bacterium]